MNSLVHHILFTLQALGYVAPALSLEEQLEAAPYADSAYDERYMRGGYRYD